MKNVNTHVSHQVYYINSNTDIRVILFCLYKKKKYVYLQIYSQ